MLPLKYFLLFLLFFWKDVRRVRDEVRRVLILGLALSTGLETFVSHSWCGASGDAWLAMLLRQGNRFAGRKMDWAREMIAT